MTLLKSPVRKGHCWVGYGPTGVPFFQTDAATLARAIHEYARAVEKGSKDALMWPPISVEDVNIGDGKRMRIPIVWKRSDLTMEPGTPTLPEATAPRLELV